MRYAGAVDRVARGEIVGAIEDYICLRNQRGEGGCVKPLRNRNDLHLGIHRVQRLLCGVDLHRADRLGAVEDLALQVGEIDLVAVGDGQAADAGRGEVERRRAAESTRADDERVRGPQLLLALDPEFGKEDVPAVAEKLLVLQFVLV